MCAVAGRSCSPIARAAKAWTQSSMPSQARFSSTDETVRDLPGERPWSRQELRVYSRPTSSSPAMPAGAHGYCARQRVGYPFHLGRCTEDRRAIRPAWRRSTCSPAPAAFSKRDDLRVRIAAGAGCRCARHVRPRPPSCTAWKQARRRPDRASSMPMPRALLEYLPDPLILFPRARLRQRVQLRRRTRRHPSSSETRCCCTTPRAVTGRSTGCVRRRLIEEPSGEVAGLRPLPMSEDERSCACAGRQ